MDMRGTSRAASGNGKRQERCVESARGNEERQRRGGSRVMDEDDGGREEDDAIYI